MQLRAKVRRYTLTLAAMEAAMMMNLLTETEAAQRIGRGAATLKRWRSEGYGPPFIRIGGRTPRYRLEAVEAWLLAQEKEPEVKP
jgi:predicted DNA-binding transcriptional regulator AlpA